MTGVRPQPAADYTGSFGAFALLCPYCGGEFVHGKHDVTGAAPGQAGLGGVGGYGRPQQIQGPGVELLLQDRGAAGAGLGAGGLGLLRGIRGHERSPG